MRYEPRVISRDQAHEQGIPDHVVNYRLKSGRWRRVLPGVYLTRPQPSHGDLIEAGLLYAGKDSLLSGAGALKLYGLLPKWPDQLLVLAPAAVRRQSYPWLHVRQTNRLPQATWTSEDLPRLAPVARAVADHALDLTRLDDVRASRPGRCNAACVPPTTFSLNSTRDLEMAAACCGKRYQTLPQAPGRPPRLEPVEPCAENGWETSSRTHRSRASAGGSITSTFSGASWGRFWNSTHGSTTLSARSGRARWTATWNSSRWATPWCTSHRRPAGQSESSSTRYGRGWPDTPQHSASPFLDQQKLRHSPVGQIF
jgi:hypothetical protein